MKLYEEKDHNKSHFHCYGCGAHGDVIDLVSRLFNLAPLDSAKKLVEDFRINISQAGRKPSIKEKLVYYSYAAQEERAYLILSNYCDYLRACRKEYAPKNRGEKLKPQFVESLNNLEEFEFYKEIFITGSREERKDFIKDFSKNLDKISKQLSTARQASHAL